MIEIETEQMRVQKFDRKCNNEPPRGREWNEQNIANSVRVQRESGIYAMVNRISNEITFNQKNNRGGTRNNQQ